MKTDEKTAEKTDGTVVRLRRETFALFDRMHQAKNRELGVPLTRGQMMEIVVSSAAGVLPVASTERPRADRDG